VKEIQGVGLPDVQAVYSGAEGELWELLMGQQIHIGGFGSSMDLAAKAGIAAGTRGVDLCCCTGAGMRFLVRFCDVGSMMGVDATRRVVELGRARCDAEGFADRVSFVLADATATGLDGGFDFVWGEDAWCYVEDKPKLIAEAARLVRPGGTVAFTDWVEGPAGLTDAEATRFLRFMKFPNFQTITGYSALLEDNGCRVELADDTGRFAPCIDLYLDMVNQQLTYDALRIIGWDLPTLEAIGCEMEFIRELAHADKVAQGLFVARKA
jgi:SAM-dependent methyltransferase